MCIFVLGRQQAEVVGVVKNKNRPMEVTATDDRPSNRDSTTETCRIKIRITGMSCSSCVNKIESSLNNKKGYIVFVTFV